MIDLNGHPVDAKIGTLTIGQDRSGATVAVHGGVGTVQFDTGTVDATTVNMAVCSTSDGSAAATGTLTVGAGGTLIVGSGGMSLANRNAGTATGNFNISGGNVICSNNIIKTTATASTAHIAMTGGSLTMAPGKSVGTPAIPIDDLTMTSATLNLSVANNFTNIVVTTLNLVDTLNTNNIATLPSIGSFPTQFPLISYVSSIGGGTLELGTLPGGFSGYISNDLVNTIWLVVTNGPFIAKTDQWGGGVNNLWDTSTLNWTNAGIAVNYNEGDFVVFDDAASANTVNLTGTRLPTSLLVSNNILNYTFLGAGSLGGPLTLVKDGSASLTLTETGGDNFSAGITVNNGTLILDNPGSAISGGLIVLGGGHRANRQQQRERRLAGRQRGGRWHVDLQTSERPQRRHGRSRAPVRWSRRAAASWLSPAPILTPASRLVTNGTLALTGTPVRSRRALRSMSPARPSMSPAPADRPR